jgi:septum formation protein
MSPAFVYLASGSPRRRELLQQIGVPFRVLGCDVDEAAHPGEAAQSYVARIAAAKAEAGWQGKPGVEAPVLAADTAVALDSRILGKPRDRADAVQMLLDLSGRTHEVLTAVVLRTAAGALSRISHSLVTFRNIQSAEAGVYWDTGEPCDKAGAYAIQGRAAVFIAELRGSYSGVMGLPLFETAELLGSAGIVPWQSMVLP